MTGQRRIHGLLLAFISILAPIISANDRVFPADRDVIFITSITPSPVIDGVETEIEATAAYNLVSQETATVSLSFNDLRPHAGAPKTAVG